MLNVLTDGPIIAWDRLYESLKEDKPPVVRTRAKIFHVHEDTQKWLETKVDAPEDRVADEQWSAIVQRPRWQRKRVARSSEPGNRNKPSIVKYRTWRKTRAQMKAKSQRGNRP